MLSTGGWVSTARLVLAFTSLGVVVDLMSPGRHPALATGAVHHHFAYRPLRPLESLREAMARSRPHTLIPVDELAVLHLEELLAESKDEAFSALVQRSLGGADVLAASRSRMTLLQLAREVGVGVPATLAVNSPADLPVAAAELGLPMVLKADATSGGRGVRIVSSVSEAEKQWQELRRPPSFTRAAWRSAVRREHTHFRVWARNEHREVTAQQRLDGAEANAMAVTHEGQVLACTCFEVLRTWNLRGPSSVVRIVRNDVMEAAVAAVAQRLRSTGFSGFDFMLAADGTPLLIEMNPRPTQLTHLTLGEGRDLVAAYVRALLGLAVDDRPAATDLDTVALFPQEWQRDPTSEFLTTAYHDVPWDCPALIERAAGEVPAMLRNDPRWRNKQ